jgi:hypothetical protein
MPLAVGNGGMSNSGAGNYLSSSFSQPPPAMSAAAAIMMTSSRHMPPLPAVPGLSLHDSMNYADVALSRSFFNGMRKKELNGRVVAPRLLTSSTLQARYRYACCT